MTAEPPAETASPVDGVEPSATAQLPAETPPPTDVVAPTEEAEPPLEPPLPTQAVEPTATSPAEPLQPTQEPIGSLRVDRA
jgi:hypothetical protein